MSRWIIEAEDAEIGRIMRLPYTELVAEITARGENPAEVLAFIDDIIQRSKAEAYRQASAHKGRRR
jgi:hypothetical protein